MTRAPSPAPAARLRQLLSVGALGLTLVGLVLAALQPPWLTDPLRALVAGAGGWAPLVYIGLNAALAPFHLNGVVIVLSPLTFGLPLAFIYSFLGSVLGCLGTYAVLARAGLGVVRVRDHWPAWMEGAARRVSRRPVLVGLAVRVVLHSGLAVEAFFLLTGCRRRTYLWITLAGVVVWVAQALLGVAVLRVAVAVDPWLGLLAVALPLGVVGVLAARARRLG